MSDYIKLATAPVLSLNDPDCGTCYVSVESDGDGWTCPVCGTSWPYSAGDGDDGTLYEEWSGEELEGDIVDEDEAETRGRRYAFDQNQAIMNRIMAAQS
jgi:hypothetical protein